MYSSFHYIEEQVEDHECDGKEMEEAIDWEDHKKSSKKPQMQNSKIYRLENILVSKIKKKCMMKISCL